MERQVGPQYRHCLFTLFIMVIGRGLSRSAKLDQRQVNPHSIACYVLTIDIYNLTGFFFWTIFRIIYQLRIGGFLSFGLNSLSFLLKFLSFFSKTLEFYNQGGLFSWNVEFYPIFLVFSSISWVKIENLRKILVITRILLLFFWQKGLLVEKLGFFHHFHD